MSACGTCRLAGCLAASTAKTKASDATGPRAATISDILNSDHRATVRREKPVTSPAPKTSSAIHHDGQIVDNVEPMASIAPILSAGAYVRNWALAACPLPGSASPIANVVTWW